MILITGASGRIARRTAELLARNGCILRLMTRSPQDAPKLINRRANCVRRLAEPAMSQAPFRRCVANYRGLFVLIILFTAVILSLYSHYFSRHVNKNQQIRLPPS